MPGSFLPVTPEEVAQRGWDAPDFVYAVGEAYVDHPSFGHAIIGRALDECSAPDPASLEAIETLDHETRLRVGLWIEKV